MLALVLGTLALAAFLGGIRAFERARVGSLVALLRWAATLGGLAMVLLLVLTGRELPALAVAVLIGPALFGWWQPAALRGAAPPPGRGGGAMTRAEALGVLGLGPGAGKAEIRAAHRRLMRAAHPDAGGSTEQATRLNQARDVLLRGR